MSGWISDAWIRRPCSLVWFCWLVAYIIMQIPFPENPLETYRGWILLNTPTPLLIWVWHKPCIKQWSGLSETIYSPLFLNTLRLRDIWLPWVIIEFTINDIFSHLVLKKYFYRDVSLFEENFGKFPVINQFVAVLLFPEDVFHKFNFWVSSIVKNFADHSLLERLTFLRVILQWWLFFIAIWHYSYWIPVFLNWFEILHYYRATLLSRSNKVIISFVFSKFSWILQEILIILELNAFYHCWPCFIVDSAHWWLDKWSFSSFRPLGTSIWAMKNGFKGARTKQ
jgi:hypothetical protein